MNKDAPRMMLRERNRAPLARMLGPRGFSENDMRSQVQCINGLPPKTWADYRRGCLGTFRGGHQKPETSRAFVHGMKTVFSLLEAEFPPAEQCKASPELLEACKKLVAGAKDVVYSPNKRRQFWGAPVKLWEALEAAIALAEPEKQ